MSDRQPPGEGDASAADPTDPGTPPTGSPPVSAPPERSGPSLQVFFALGLVAALIAAAVGVVLVGGEVQSGDTSSTSTSRGASANAAADPAAAVPAGPPVELQLYVARNAQAEPLEPGEELAVGDQVVFEVSTEEPARVRVWAEVDGLPKQQLGAVELEGGTASVGDGSGLAAWGFGNPGIVVFRASTAPAGCPRGSCASWAVTVR